MNSEVQLSTRWSGFSAWLGDHGVGGDFVLQSLVHLCFRVATNDYFHYRFNPGILFSIVWFIKCQKIVKKDHHNLLKPKFTYWNRLFCPKPKDVLFNKDVQFNIIELKKISTYSHLHCWNQSMFIDLCRFYDINWLIVSVLLCCLHCLVLQSCCKWRKICWSFG